MPLSRAQSSGGHGTVVPPVPIPNTEVKRCSADDSMTIGYAKVGRRQLISKTPFACNNADGVFAFVPSAATFYAFYALIGNAHREGNPRQSVSGRYVQAPAQSNDQHRATAYPQSLGHRASSATLSASPKPSRADVVHSPDQPRVKGAMFDAYGQTTTRFLPIAQSTPWPKCVANPPPKNTNSKLPNGLSQCHSHLTPSTGAQTIAPPPGAGRSGRESGLEVRVATNTCGPD